MNGQSAADRRPPLSGILRRDDFERCLKPFLALGIDGVTLFDVAGVAYATAASPQSPLSKWEQLPAEAQMGERPAHSFGLDDHTFHVRPAYAGADRVGALVFSCPVDREEVGAVVEALSAVVGQLLQAGFATWVTSELHLATSESSYQAVTQQNAELRRAVEHLRHIDQLKSNFLATVSHELRTPLTSVIGFSEMLLEGLAGPMTDEQREYVGTILERGEELLTLITQILEMSRLEVGAMRLDLRPHEPAVLVGKAIGTVEYAANKASVTVHTAVDGLPPLLVDGDKIHQVLVNLLGNAIKFSRSGGTVRVEAQLAPIRRPFEEEDFFGEEVSDAVRVTVRDEGVGIPREQLERIFEAFYQVDASPTREHGGAGLGLAIVKSLVTAHGGDVWADSVAGSGTSFHFTVPVASEAAKAAPASEDQSVEIDPGDAS